MQIEPQLRPDSDVLRASMRIGDYVLIEAIMTAILHRRWENRARRSNDVRGAVPEYLKCVWSDP